MRPRLEKFCPKCGAKMAERVDGGFHCVFPHRSKIPTWLRILCVMILCVLAVAWVCGCSTVTPPKIADKEASWDGNEQNSGFIGFDSHGYGIITPRARDRYNALIADYGRSFKPPLKPDDGISVAATDKESLTVRFRIDREHLTKFGIMNRWKKEGKPPD